MGAFQVNFPYDATLVRPIRNVTSGAGTSYFLEKCSGGGEPIAVMAITSAGDAVVGGSAPPSFREKSSGRGELIAVMAVTSAVISVVGGSALGPVGTGCKTSALNP